jgi:uncharacterized protein (TIGR02302 family)
MAAGGPKETSDALKEGATSMFGTLINRARLTIAWERLWPRLAPLLGLFALFVALSWFALFEALPLLARWAVLALFLTAGLACLVPFAGLRIPTRAEALGRLDRETGLPHRPATALGDHQATAPSDPVSRALWAAHLRDAEAKASGVRLRLPSPGLPARDRYALRIALLLALAVSFFFAGPERGSRLLSAFRAASEVEESASVRIDAWVTPPPYTRRPPLLLTEQRFSTPILVPQHSVLVVRVAGDEAAAILAAGNATEVATTTAAPGPAATGVVEKRLTLNGDASVAVRRGGEEAASFRFTVIPDKPPTIAFEGPIKTAVRGAMTLTYKVEDDYGVMSAEAEVRMAQRAGAHPLYEPPKIPLSLPAGRARSGVASSTRDVSEHPFAGAPARMTLVARDDAGNAGRSEAQETILPGRLFVKPLARALVEQRRKLALDANQAEAVEQALDGLMIAPEIFTKNAGIYLGLRTARIRLDNAFTDEAKRDVVTYLWQIALRIEEGDLSDAERRLKAAQERLREALERGATPEKIEKLTQELREALNNFLREYAQRLAQQRRNGEERNGRTPDHTVTPDDLNRMLDRLQDMAKNGARDEARDLLSELNDILENLQSPEQGEFAEDPAMQEMQRSLDEMSRMIQRQQRLRDQTFRQRRQGEQSEQGPDAKNDEAQNGEDGEQGQDGQQGQDQAGNEGNGQRGGLQGLRQRQEALRRQLEEMRKRLGEMGVPGGNELGQAEQAMREAEGQLGRRDGEGAVGSQGKAIEALRRGAQGLAQQLQQAQQGQDGQGPGQGQPGRSQRAGRGTGNGDDRDPLGRPTRSRGYSDGAVKVPGRGETDMERAARVLEELRRRFSDPLRPQIELDYIERLLRRE